MHVLTVADLLDLPDVDLGAECLDSRLPIMIADRRLTIFHGSKKTRRMSTRAEKVAAGSVWTILEGLGECAVRGGAAL